MLEHPQRALIDAIKDRDLPLIKELLEGKYKAIDPTGTFWAWCVVQDTPDDISSQILDCMLEHEKFNTGDAGLFSAVIHRDYVQVATKLLQHGADANAVIREPTYHDARPIHLVRSREMASLLLKHGADVNGRDGEGKSPLMRLAMTFATIDHNFPFYSIANQLLKQGADVTLRDHQDDKILYILTDRVRRGLIRNDTELRRLIKRLRTCEFNSVT